MKSNKSLLQEHTLHTKQCLQRIISGALRSAIRDHGPIDKLLIDSASKRIAGELNAQILREIAEILPSQVIAEKDKEILSYRERVHKLTQSSRKLWEQIQDLKRKYEKMFKQQIELNMLDDSYTLNLKSQLNSRDSFSE